MATQPSNHMKGTVEFPFNVPITLKLTFPRGKLCANGERALFSTDDGRVLFLDLETARRIEEMNIKPGEPILITHQKLGKEAASWLIQRAADLEGQLAASLAKFGPQTDGTFVVPAAPAPAAETPRKPIASATSLLVQEATGLVDAYMEVLAQARKSHGDAVDPDAIRTLVTTCYIQRARLSSVA